MVSSAAAMLASPRPYRILCFGDSVTAGYYDKGRKFEPYSKTLCEALNEAGRPCVVHTCGLVGLTAAQMVESLAFPVVKDMLGRLRKGLTRILEEDGPQDLVLLMAGTNDLGKHLGVEATVASVSQLHRACQEQGVPVVILSPPHVTKGVIRENRNLFHLALQDWALQTPGILGFYDSEELVPHGRDNEFGFWEPEEFHLSPKGSMELGRRMAALLLPLLQKLHPGITSCKSVHRLVMPTHESLEAVGQATYAVGDAIQVWSNSWQTWCPGTVQEVEDTAAVDPMITVVLKLPDQSTALKRLPSSDDGLRLVNLPAAPRAASVSGSTYKADDEVEVWIEESSAWCPGQVRRTSDQKVVVQVALGGKVLIKAFDSSAVRPAIAAAPALVTRPLSPGPGTLHTQNRSVPAPPLSSTNSLNIAYSEGDEVEVWSNSFCTWCAGVIVKVDGQAVVTELLLPSGALARKPLVLGKGGLRKRRSGSPPRSQSRGRGSLLVDYHAELGITGLDAEPAMSPRPVTPRAVTPRAVSPRAVNPGTVAAGGAAVVTAGAAVTVWSKSNQVWCSGIVENVQGIIVTLCFVLPDGSVARKEMMLGDPGLIAGRVLPSHPPPDSAAPGVPGGA